MTDTQPKLLAHRGYAARYPENTREAIQAAVDAGARYVEFDIQLNRDQQPYLLHDSGFSRTANVDVDIFELSAGEIAGIPVSERQRLGAEGPDVFAPALVDVVGDLQGWPEVTAFVEIKKQSVDRYGVGAVMDAVLPVLEPVADQCVIISFEKSVVELARHRAGIPIGWAFRSYDEECRHYAETLGPEFLFFNVDRLPSGAEKLWAGCWMWVIYEIIDPLEAMALFARGVGMVETMQPTEMHAGLTALK